MNRDQTELLLGTLIDSSCESDFHDFVICTYFSQIKDEKETLAGLIGKSNRMGGTGSLVLGEIAKAYAQEDKFEGD